MDIREQYREKAIQYAEKYGYEKISDHILDIMVSIMATRDKTSYSGGHFVNAIINNDLRGAINRADDECFKYLKLLVMCEYNCYLEKSNEVINY
jgi:hypothetical protein